MTEYDDVTKTVVVPASAGLDGFLHAIKHVLRKSRVQEIVINARGELSYRRWVARHEPADDPNVGIDFEDLTPHGVLRSARVDEYHPRTTVPALVLAELFDEVATEQMNPIAFLVGSDTTLWGWLGTKTRSREYLYGVKVIPDRAIPDTVLALAMGYGRDAALVDTKKALKIEMSSQERWSIGVDL